MEFVSTKNGDHLVVEVAGRLDAVTNAEFDEQCASWLAQNEKSVIVDLSNLEYVSSAGLRSILSAAKKMKAAQAKLVFCGLSGMVQEVFTVSGFAALLPIFPTLDEALAG